MVLLEALTVNYLLFTPLYDFNVFIFWFSRFLSGFILYVILGLKYFCVLRVSIDCQDSLYSKLDWLKYLLLFFFLFT